MHLQKHNGTKKMSFVLPRHMGSCVIYVVHLANSCTVLMYAPFPFGKNTNTDTLPNHNHLNTLDAHLRCIMKASVPRLAVNPWEPGFIFASVQNTRPAATCHFGERGHISLFTLLIINNCVETTLRVPRRHGSSTQSARAHLCTTNQKH